jgi:hypothetical protein
MSSAPGELERMLKERHREVRFVTSFVILALVGSISLLWPSVQAAAVERFGPFFPSRVLGGELLVLIVLFICYLWRKTGQIEQLVGRLITESGRGRQLEELLAQARSVLEASVQLNLDDDAGESLQKILHCVTEGLRADRGVLWRQRAEGRAPDREAVFPSLTEVPDPLALAFEDEVARKILALGETLVIDEKTDLEQLGITAARPRKGWKRLVASPLMVDGKAVGVLMLCNPDAVPDGEEDEAGASRLGLLEVFAGFAAGVLRNLRVFQAIARRNTELIRARELLCDHQRELAEIDAVATMSRVAKSLAHGMSGPLTAIAGYTDVVLTAKPDALTLQGAREGLRREIDALKQRLHKVVEFTQTWRRSYGVVDLNQIVETAVALHSEPLRARGVTCRFEPHPGLPYTVADPVRLRQVFLCLLSFVRGALREGSSAEMRVRTLADSGTLRVYVDFPGRAGLTELVAPLLDPNVEVTTLARERNLDLPVAVSIIRDHRGDLEIETLEDLGTRIIVQLPILSDAPEMHPSEPDPDVSLDEVLNRIFGDDSDHAVEPLPAPARRAPAAAAAPRHVPVTIAPPQLPPAPPVTTAAAVGMNSNVSPLRPTGEHAAAQKPAPAEPAAPTAPPLPAPTTGPDGAGLNDLFGASEMWRGTSAPTPAPKRSPDAPRHETRRTLLEQSEVEGALKMFDEVEEAGAPPKE